MPIIWEEPPTRQEAKEAVAARLTPNDKIAKRLREHAGEWGRIYTLVHEDPGTASNRASGRSHHINKGGVKAFRPAGHYQAKARALTPTKAGVWARYVGPDGANSEGESEGNDL